MLIAHRLSHYTHYNRHRQQRNTLVSSQGRNIRYLAQVKMSGPEHGAIRRSGLAGTRILSTLRNITGRPAPHSRCTKVDQDGTQSVAWWVAVLEKQQRPAQARPAHLLYGGGELQIAPPTIGASGARRCPQRLHCTRRVSTVLTASASRRGHPTFRAHHVKNRTF